METKLFLLPSLILFISANSCLAQQDSISAKKIIYGFKAGALNDDGEQGPGGYIHFTMEKGHSYFSAGPLFSQKKRVVGRSNGDDIPFYCNNYGLTGFNAVYQISPNPKSKVFQSYFQNELLFHYFMDNGTTRNPNDGDDYLTTAIPYKSHQMVIQDFLGWGFKVKFLKNFYLNQSISFGLAYYSTVQNYNDINYNSTGHNFFPAALFEIGLGYKFDYKYKLPSISFKHKISIASYSALSIEQLDSISAISAKWTSPIEIKRNIYGVNTCISAISIKPKDSITVQNNIYGVNIGIMPSFQGTAIDYFAHFTIENGKNFLAAGPVIGSKAEIDYHFNHFETGIYDLTGFHIEYQRHPDPKGKIFDLYVQNEFIFNYYTDKGINYLSLANSYYPKILSYKSHETDIGDCIGYGCKEKFLKNFYLNQSIGLGIIHHSTIIEYGDNNYNSEVKLNEFLVIVKMSLGYKFDYKSKPKTSVSSL